MNGTHRFCSLFQAPPTVQLSPYEITKRRAYFLQFGILLKRISHPLKHLVWKLQTLNRIHRKQVVQYTNYETNYLHQCIVLKSFTL